jgi:flagellar biosynthesis/type III secretory pathway M-ring protein FliF/YscJ
LSTLAEDKSPERRGQAMLLDMMIVIPQRYVHETAFTPSEAVTFWVVVGIIVVLIAVATIVLVMVGKRSERRQSQLKEAELHHEAPIQPQGSEQPQVHAPKEEEEEKVLIPQ